MALLRLGFDTSKTIIALLAQNKKHTGIKSFCFVVTYLYFEGEVYEALFFVLHHVCGLF